MPVDWTNVPTVEIPVRPVVRCPNCGETARTIIRVMERENDGSQTRRCICKRCSSPYLEIEDPDLCQTWQNQLDTPVD